MTLSSLVLLMFAQVNPGGTGQVTAVLGDVRISRANQESSLRAGDVISTGDRVSTGVDGRTVIYWSDGLLVYIGNSTQMSLLQESTPRRLALERGEIRATVGRNMGVVITTPHVEATMNHGIIRAAVASKSERFSVESGVARLRSLEKLAARKSGNRRFLQTARNVIDQISFQPANKDKSLNGTEVTLNSGRQITYLAGKGFEKPVAFNASDWSVNVSELRSAAQNQMDQLRSPTPTPPVAPPVSDEAGSGGSSQFSGTGNINLSLGNVLASSSAGSAGGLFSDAGQNTLAGMLTADYGNLTAGSNFTGNIHFVTGQTSYTLQGVTLNSSDNFTSGFVSGRQFWSIGTGASPTGQILTGIGTGTSAQPNVVRIPKFNAYLVDLDQFSIVDPASNDAIGNQAFAVPGLVGEIPSNPNIVGATPLFDERSQINDRATFALGEFSVELSSTNNPQFTIRRSDQDRKIIKDIGNDDNLDLVTVNTDVTSFDDTPDPTFFPSLSTVKVPTRNSLANMPRYRSLKFLRKAAMTTLMAHKLSGYARRTGQTRFVVDGRIIDISGYKGP